MRLTFDNDGRIEENRRSQEPLEKEAEAGPTVGECRE